MSVYVPASLELQPAIVVLLTADAGVKAALPGGRIYDRVPGDVNQLFVEGKGPTYVTIGDGRETFDLAGSDRADEAEEDYECSDHFIALHVWSQTVGFIEAKAIAYAMRRAIKTAFRAGALTLANNDILQIDPVSLECGRSEDQITAHAVLTVRVKTVCR